MALVGPLRGIECNTMHRKLSEARCSKLKKKRKNTNSFCGIIHVFNTIFTFHIDVNVVLLEKKFK